MENGREYIECIQEGLECSVIDLMVEISIACLHVNEMTFGRSLECDALSEEFQEASQIYQTTEVPWLCDVTLIRPH